MKYRGRLFGLRPYGHADDELFISALRENCSYQYRNNSLYRAILDAEGFSPEKLRSCGDLPKLPPIPTLVFKNHLLYSVKKPGTLLRLTSSGTGGKASEVGYDIGALYCALKMVLRVCSARRLFSLTPCHYIIMGYRPRRDNRAGVTKTAYGATLFTPALSRSYAIEYRNGAYEPDLDGVINAIIKHSKSRFPLRTMGFPSYTYFVMRRMEEQGISVKLPKGSKILLGGGWKQHYTEEVDKSVFYDLAQRVLGITDDSIVEFFGAVEHPILYCDCPHHHFHVPAYSRVIIRDPYTMQPLGYGQPGLISLITPLVKAMPMLNVMTDDLAVLHDGKECGCGIQEPYIEIIGRVGLQSLKTCAAGAAELMKEGKS